MLESNYDFANWASVGIVGMVDGAINPTDPLSKEHWENSFGTVILISGVKPNVATRIDDATTTVTKGPGKSTGARELSVEEYFKRETQAKEMYNNIRNTTDDVSRIAKNTDMSAERVQRIKDHLFNNEHILTEGKGKFNPDYDIAQAWNRMKEGTYTKSDIDLLNHELFESKFEGIFKTDYRTAHDATDKSGRTWTPEE